jgi:uncharacterized protein YbaR (Trm112 family)
MNIENLQKIKSLYQEGKNLMQYFRDSKNFDRNDTDAILISYDFQAGSYVKFVEEHQKFSNEYTTALSKVLSKLGGNSILEAGVGEATTLANLLPKMEHTYDDVYGFDISWSRVRHGKEYLVKKGFANTQLVTGDMFSSPFADNAFDIVYTSHTLEPNGGREKEALEALYRITNKYLILLEPSYELGSKEAKERMERNGYIKGLKETAGSLGYNIIEYRLFDTFYTELNPTALMIIEKPANSNKSDSPKLACPITKAPLELYDGSYYCDQSMLAYPIINEIPCLLPDNAVIATHYKSFTK